MNTKILLPRQECNFFTGEHGLCFAGYRRGAQPEGWRFDAHKVEATPFLKIEPRLRGATVGDTTFGPIAEGARRPDRTCAGAKAKDERR